jgi:hypothetical protein
MLKTKDTNRTIDDLIKGTTLYLVDDKGNRWKQTEYRGELVFGEKDFFTLLAEMNNMTCKCKSDICKMIGGSDMFFNEDLKNELIIPNIVETADWVWKP